jgi:hypothetical protein
LLVAMVITAVVLGAAFGWVWTLGSLAGGADDRAQAATLAAAAERTVEADVSASVAVGAPPDGRNPAVAVSLTHDRVDRAQESVVLAWDSARRVLWRNAGGTYVADHVSEFSLAYRLADGSCVDGAAMSAASWAGVRALRVHLATAIGRAHTARTFEVALGPA